MLRIPTVLLAAAGLAALGAGPALASATVVLTDGQVLEGADVRREGDLVTLILATGEALSLPAALVAEIRLAAAGGDTQGAEALINALPLDLLGDPDVVALSGQLRFANVLSGAPPEPELRARLAADPADSEASYQLAAHRVSRGDYEGALELLFGLMRRDRSYGDDAGRKGMLMIFDLLGGSGDLVSRWRSRIFTAMH